jgi:hypothetical protein
MYLLDVELNLSEQLKVVYGKNLKKLREKILGNEAFFNIH